MRATYKHTIPFGITEILSAYRDQHFYVQKQKHFGAISVEILQWDEDAAGKIHYRAKITEPSRQPAFIRKSDEDTYVDESVLDTQKNTLVWKVIPEKLADKFTMNGSVEFHPANENETKAVYNLEFKVKIPLLGSKIEKYVLEQTEEETAKQAEYLKTWLAASSNP